MRDGFILRGVKAVVRVVVAGQLAIHRRVADLAGHRRHELGGRCVLSGCCCERPTVRVPPGLWSRPLLRRCVLAWQERVNGFVFVAAHDGGLVEFRCTHFDHRTRRCDSYDSRPAMCRDYPRNLLDGPRPQLFPACGHRLVPRGADDILAACADAGLSGDQIDAVRRRLEGTPGSGGAKGGK